MKTLIAVLVAAGVGFAGAYFFVSKNNQASVQAKLDAQQASSAAEMQKLNEALAKANNQAARIMLTAPPYAVKPDEVLQRLSLIDPSVPELRTRKIREIIHQLEYLVDAGTNSFLPIRHFIATGADVNYTFEDARGGMGASFWSWRPGMELRSGLVLPPSLRISLVDVMRYIGTEDAEVSLAWMLSTSAHGMEIPYIALALEKMAPGRYTDLAIQAAKNQLLSSATNATPSHAEQLGNGYVFGWLASRGDTSMVQVAESMLLNKDGSFNQEAGRYLLNGDKATAMQELATVYGKGDSQTKNAIIPLVASGAGTDPSADQILKDWLLGSGIEGDQGALTARPRASLIGSMAGPFPPFNSPAPTDPDIIRQRIAFLEGLQPDLNTALLKSITDQTLAKLRALPGSH